MPANPPVEVFITADAADSRIGTEGFMDGSNAVKFDLLMRSFQEDTIINLTEGIFSTTGSWAYNEVLGFRTKSRWHVRGTGDYDTTVRRIAFPVWPTPINHGIFQMDMYDSGGVTLENLVLDENWQNMGIAKANSSFAASLVGSNCTMRRLRPLNSHGDRESLMEAFILAIIASHNRVDGWNNCTGGLIEECEIPDGSDVDYAIGMALLGGADGHTGSVQGAIRKNNVKNFIGTSAFGFGSNVILEDNETTGCRQSFYFDTGVCENTTIRRNRMLNSSWAAIHIVPNLGAARVGNLVIEDNEIKISGSTPHDVGVQLLTPLGRGHLKDITIRRNTFVTTSGHPAITAQDVDGLTIENNVANGWSKLDYLGHENTNMVVRGNRTPAGAVPTGLEDIAPPINPITIMEQQLTEIVASLAQQTSLITALKQQLATSAAVIARLQALVSAVQAAAATNLEKLSAP